MKEKETKSKGITLVALIITIIVMLILVGVSIQVVINSDLIGTAQDAANSTKTAYRQEEKMNNVTIEGTEYNIIEEYISQIECEHEWGNAEITKRANCSEDGKQKKTCTKCGKQVEEIIEKNQNHIIGNGVCIKCGQTYGLEIGGYIEGYNPGIGKDGDIKTTSYESKGAQTGGTNIDGTSGNGYGNQEFGFTKDGFTTTEEEKAAGKTKWRIIGEEDGQIIITTANPIQTTGGSNYYLQGQAGYEILIEELNKISGIYGQGKYADTRKYSYEIDGTKIESGGRSLKVEDIGYTLVEETKTYTTNADGNVVKDNGTVGLTFTYWGEDDTNVETGAEWFTLGANESATMVKRTLSGGNSEIRSVVGQDSEGNSVYSWLASRYVEFESGRVRLDARIINSSDINSFRLFYSYNAARSSSYGIRPVVYLESDIQLEYNSETEIYTIIP